MARLTRVEEGIFTYHEKSGVEKFAVRFQHRGRDWRKFGFPTLTKARLWRESRKGRAAEWKLFPEQELAEYLREEQERAAREQAEQVRLEQERAVTRSPLFRDYALTWLQTCRAKRLKHSTLLRYDGIVHKHLLPSLGEIRLHDLGRGQIRQLTVTLQNAAAPKTIHNVVRVVSAIFAQANEDGLVAHNPASVPSKLVRIPKQPDQVEVFTREEEELILQEAKQRLPAYYVFILLLFRTGLRQGEAVALERDDLQLRSRYLMVQRNFTAGQLADSPKGGRTRKVDLARDVVPVLQDHLAMQEAEAALAGEPRPRWLFTTPQGEIIRSNNFRDRIWKPFLKALGLHYRNVHAIRHTFATRMIMAGANPVYVQKQLGHSSIQITVDLYTHWVEEVKRHETLEVDRLLEAPQGQALGTPAGTPGQSNR